MATRPKFVPLGVIAGVLLVGGPGLRGGNGGVSGQLTDPQGKPVADAKVSIARDRDSRARVTHTDSDGKYAFYSLPTGSYTLAAAASGFVDISQTAVIDVDV